MYCVFFRGVFVLCIVFKVCVFVVCGLNVVFSVACVLFKKYCVLVV